MSQLLSKHTPSFIENLKAGLKYLWRKIRRQENDATLRETIEELIEETNGRPTTIDSDEKVLLGNVLSLRDSTAQDIMIPRADIVAVPINISGPDLIALVAKSGYSRFPVYRDTLDNVVGMVHIKDILGWSQSQKPLKIKTLIQDVLFVAPTMRTLDMIFQMKQTGTKMALVVDEYGGIDGLVTLSDLMEEIIGDIQDVHDITTPQLQIKADGSVSADARVRLEEVEEKLGYNLHLPESEDGIDTLGGLITTIAGHVPSRGELIQHPKGFEFEVLEADPRRIKKLCIRGFKK